MSAGGKRRIHAPRKLSHDQAREISVLISQGVQGKVIADRYNVGRRTIYTALARLETEGVAMNTIKTMSQRFRDLAAEELIITLKSEIKELRAAVERKDALLRDLIGFFPKHDQAAAAITKELS